MFSDLLRSIADGVPSQCAVCHAWPARPVCAGCVAGFAPTRPRCSLCALPLDAGHPTCGACLREPPPLDACLAAVDYAFPWSGIVQRFKFRQQPGWAATLAGLLRRVPGVPDALEDAEQVLPMPAADARLRARGFNQALLLARGLAPDKAEAELLLRLHNTPPQTALSRAQRERNVRDAFAVEPLLAQRLRGARVLLVDDVMTSGSSLHAAARTLRRAGAAQVTAVVFARAPLPASDAARVRVEQTA